MRYIFLLFLLPVVANAQYNFQSFDIHPQVDKGSEPAFFTEFKGKTYFIAKDTSGIELRVYDGSSISLVADLVPGISDGAAYRPLFVHDNILYFAGGTSADGRELYSYDGANPPTLVHEIQPGTFSSYPYIFGAINNRLYLTDSGANKQDLYEYNISTKQLYRITGTSGNSVTGVEHQGIVYNNKLYFAGISTATGAELYEYDPTDSSVTLIADIYQGINSSRISDFLVANGKLYFMAISSDYGREIYEYDGTGAPTHITDILNPGSDASFPLSVRRPFTGHYGKLYFTTDSSFTNNHPQLFEYDLTSATITAIKDMPFTADNFLSYGKRVFFSHGLKPCYYDIFTGKYECVDTLISNYAALGFNNPAVSQNRIFYSAGINPPPKQLFNIELCILYDSSVSIIDKSAVHASSATIYPNPTTGDAQLEFILDAPQKLTLRITDMNGRMVYSSNTDTYNSGKHTLFIPSGKLPAGIYLYTFTNSLQISILSGKLLKH